MKIWQKTLRAALIGCFILNGWLVALAIDEPESPVGTVSVSATVYGSNPIVTNFTPTSGTNDGATAITQIVGRNFTSAYVVTLDDTNSTLLTGSITITADCDSTGNNCGSGGGYDKITGLSVPSGVTPGNYNILVTTPNGTNVTSDSQFTVSAPAPGADPSITSVSPNPVVTSVGATSSVELAVSDADSDTVYYSVDENGGTWDSSTGSIAIASEVGSVSLSYTGTTYAAPATNTFEVNDTGFPGVADDSLAVEFYVFNW